MMAPTQLIAHPDAVVAELRATSGEEAIRELHAALCAATPDVRQPPLLLADLVERASESSVCITEQIALPHARTLSVERMVLAVGRSARGLPFDPAHPAVRLVFLIGTPRQQVAEYLKMVSTLMRFLKSAEVRQRLIAAGTEDEFRAALAPAAQPAA